MTEYTCSEALLQRALECIPLGCQTFSKSYLHYPRGGSPLFADHGQGAYLTDVDGNEYLDLVNALAAVTLGYNDHDVNQAIIQQLDKGIIFSLSHQLEAQLAEELVELIPCAEMVRYGKNGSDATTAAIRLARAYTERDEVVVCGYHGWHDWYIGSTAKNRGVPEQTKQLTHTFQYNDIESLERVFAERQGHIAAVIMEPMNCVYPEANFLQKVRALCDLNNTLLIFDETVTGFRLGLSGAQGLFGVTPDLATFGKGIANGMPLSVVTGKRDIMMLFEEVFYSFTYGGELLSIAAALATIGKLKKVQALESMEALGKQLSLGIQDAINDLDMAELLSVSGHPAWSFFNIHESNPDTLQLWKTLYMQEMLKQKVICLGSHNISYAHTEETIQRVIGAYQQTLSVFKQAHQDNNIMKHLTVEPLKPLFAVRKKSE